MTYQFKIQLRGITKPPVWRRLQIPAEYSFYDLHCIIQIAFGWNNVHLFKFQKNPYDCGWEITEKNEELDEMTYHSFWNIQKPKDARTTKIGKFIESKNLKKFTYIYDFGDDWFHDITVEAVTEENLLFPKCVTGKGACPPEDCGGVWGYEDMKTSLLEHPNSSDAKTYREWLGLDKGEEFDPKAFDLDDVNRCLVDMFLTNKS